MKFPALEPQIFLEEFLGGGWHILTNFVNLALEMGLYFGEPSAIFRMKLHAPAVRMGA